MQSLFIGLGAVVASALPYLLTQVFSLGATGRRHTIPFNVKLSFYIGAVAFLGAVLWTIVSTKEYPPEDLEAFRRMTAARKGLISGAGEIARAIREMPSTMRQLAWVQVFTWLGLFCMWLYFPVAAARNVFGAPDETSPLYSRGVEWAGVCFAMYSVVCFAFSFALPKLAGALGRRATHAICLLCGAAGLLSVGVIHSQMLLLLSMTGVGIAWASILAMPYSILAGALPPQRTGVYMGIFNFFIVIPEIIAAVGLGWVMTHLLGNNRLAAVIAGGVCLALAALLVSRVEEAAAPESAPQGSPAVEVA